MRARLRIILLSLLCCASVFVAIRARADRYEGKLTVDRVLLLSVDGMHAFDLANYVATHPASTFTQLTNMGITYTNATATQPSDSFPGLLSMVTGGSPATMGFYYDTGYDRSLSPPNSTCATVGTPVQWKQNLDFNSTLLNAGGGINPAKLPRDPANGCAPVYPHQFLKVNTVFEVIKAAGKRTAWSDKHPAYEVVKGPSGTGVDDLYTPEIQNTEIGLATIGVATVTTNSLALTKIYDDLKVTAILNEIAGKDHTGTPGAGVPAIFGMNFQALSVAQKLSPTPLVPFGPTVTGGYADAAGTPGPAVADALDFVDQRIGLMVSALQSGGLLDSTLIIVSAKHGQTPVDRSQLARTDPAIITNLVNTFPGGQAQLAADCVALLWLKDQSQTSNVASSLVANTATDGLNQIISGTALTQLFPDPLVDARTPDIVGLPRYGVVYTTTGTKIADHGGFSDENTHVPILLANPRLTKAAKDDAVRIAQIAPTILKVMKLDPESLQGVQIEGTEVLGAGLNLKE